MYWYALNSFFHSDFRIIDDYFVRRKEPGYRQKDLARFKHVDSFGGRIESYNSLHRQLSQTKKGKVCNNEKRSGNAAGGISDAGVDGGFLR